MAYVFRKSTTVKSEVCEGVEFIVRKMTENRRIELQMAVMEPNEKIRGLLTRIATMKTESGNDERNVPVMARANDEMQAIITKELNPVKIRWGISAVKGLEIADGDGTIPATMDNLLDWPSDLIEEALNIVDEGCGMSEKETKNSVSPITFGEVMDRRQANTTATPAAATSAS
jgi:hypothetical protein